MGQISLLLALFIRNQALQRIKSFYDQFQQEEIKNKRGIYTSNSNGFVSTHFGIAPTIVLCIRVKTVAVLSSTFIIPPTMIHPIEKNIIQ
jgi:hypothetical protein